MRLQESPPATEYSADNDQTTEYLLLNKLGKRFPWLRNKLLELFGVDLRTLALMRISIGVVLLIDLLWRLPQLRAFYSDEGVMPRSAIYESFPRSWYFSFHLLSGRVEIESLMFAISIVLAVMLILGFKTRFASFWSWLLLISLHARNPFIIHGGGTLLRMLLFWGMFVPWGTRFSIESSLNTRKEELPKQLVSVGAAALILQMPLVYFFTGMLKNGNEWRHDFTAISYVLKASTFALPLGERLTSFPTVLKFFTAGTLALEIGGSLLLFSPIFTKPLRYSICAAFLALQLGFLFTLKLGTFPLISTVGLLAFVPSSFWDFLSREQNEKREILTIYYDAECDFCYKLLLLIKGFLVLPQARLLAAQSSPIFHEEMKARNSWIVVGKDDIHRFKFLALVHLIHVSPIFWPMAWVLGSAANKTLGDALYDLVANNRRVSARTVAWLRVRTLHVRQPLIVSLLCSFFLTYVVIDNLGGIKRLRIGIPSKLAFIGQTLRIHQYWKLFAPSPVRNSIWFVVNGSLADGRTVNLFDGSPDSSQNPDNQELLVKSYNWRAYWGWATLEDGKYLAPHAARYFCDSWNKTHDESVALQGVAILEMQKPTRLDGPEEQPHESTFLGYPCSTAIP